jgi:hypothetical protein
LYRVPANNCSCRINDACLQVLQAYQHIQTTEFSIEITERLCSKV